MYVPLLDSFGTVTKNGHLFFYLTLFLHYRKKKTQKTTILQVKRTDRIIYLQQPLRTQINSLSWIHILYLMIQELGRLQLPCQVCFFLWQRLRMTAEGLQFYCCLVKDILLSLHFRRAHKNNHKSFWRPSP